MTSHQRLVARNILDRTLSAFNCVRSQDRPVVTESMRLIDIFNSGISAEEMSLAFMSTIGEEPPTSLFHPEQTMSETSALLSLSGFESIQDL